jgi:phosphonate transport system substrate-binding protein
MGTPRVASAARARGLRAANLLLATVAAALVSCRGEPHPSYAPEYGPRPTLAPTVYRFAVHPLHNPQRLVEVYGPIVAYLNARLGGPTFRLEAARSYEAFESNLYGRSYDLALPNPAQAVNSVRSGYRIFGKMGDDREFRGLILVRRDSGLLRVEQLKGKVVSFPAPTALAATMMPLWYLHTHGLDANKEIRRLYTGSQESSLMSAYLGHAAAAAAWTVPWKAFQRQRPEVAAALEVRWETDPLVNNALVARDDLPPELVARVGALLFALHQTPEGARLLAEVPVSRFEPASSETYEPVRAFLDRYRRSVQ